MKRVECDRPTHKWLASKNNIATRRGYAKDAARFDRWTGGDELFDRLLEMGPEEAKTNLSQHRNSMQADGLGVRTIRRQLRSALSFLAWARADAGLIDWAVDIRLPRETPTSQPHRSVTLEMALQASRMLGQSARDRRDRAIIMMLAHNWKRGAIVALDVTDVGDEGMVFCRKKQRFRHLSQLADTCLRQWIAAKPAVGDVDALFVSLDNRTRGQRLSGEAVTRMTRRHFQ